MDYHKPKYVWVTTFFPHLLKSNRLDYEFINANENGFIEIDKLLDIGYDKIPENDYEYLVVAFHDDKDETLYRKDADVDEIKRIKNDPDGYAKLWREFQTDKQPAYWVVWPFSTSKGWCDRITGRL